MGEIGTGSFPDKNETAIENEDESDQAKASSLLYASYVKFLLQVLLH